MKIGLVDVDSHNFPNIPLMKLSAYHKKKGDNVEFAKAGTVYDRLYMSKIFTESQEPQGMKAEEIIRGGSGYDLRNKLPEEIEHTYPDYGIYPELTKDTACGMLTRGCPRKDHGFCITPEKDGCISRKSADLKEFWNGQSNIILLDQNLLACKDRSDLLGQLREAGARVDFQGGTDIRFLNGSLIEELRGIKVKDFHFAWDNPKEDLKEKFRTFKESGIKNPDRTSVYVLTNYWSSIEEDLYRVYTLREMGFVPYVMIYDKQKFVNQYGKWRKGIEQKYTREQMIHFKTCQHMQRWSSSRSVIKICPDFRNYEPYRKWKRSGFPVPGWGT